MVFCIVPSLCFRVFVLSDCSVLACCEHLRPGTRMHLTSKRSEHVSLESAFQLPSISDACLTSLIVPSFWVPQLASRPPIPPAALGEGCAEAAGAQPPTWPVRRRGAGTRWRGTCRLFCAHPSDLAGGQARPVPLDEGGEGPGLTGGDVAAKPQAAAGGVDPTGLPRPEGADLTAAAAGLPGSLRAVRRDGRAQSEPLRRAGGAEHRLRTAGDAGGRQGRQLQQQRRKQQRREPAAAQRAPRTAHAAEQGPGGSRRHLTHIRLARAIYTVLCLSINL